MNTDPSNEPVYETPPESGKDLHEEGENGGKVPFKNTTNFRRLVMFLASAVMGMLTQFITSLFFDLIGELMFGFVYGIFGLVVFEILFHTRKRWSLKTLSLYVIIITLVVYFLSYLFGGLFLFRPIQIILTAAIAYYLIKVYRMDSWVMPESQPKQPRQPLSRNEKIRDFSIGFIGWWVVNVLIWALMSLIGPDSQGIIFMTINLFVFPINVLVLIFLAFRRRWAALGILATYAVNFVIALIIGLDVNAFCWVPFTYNN